jgi:hypothetical protein
MKHWYLVLCIVFALNVSAQDRIDDKALLQMSIVEVLDSLQIPSAYKQRHEILLSLCHEGVIIFDGTLNPYGDDLPSEYECYYYIGTAKQNAKFVRNIVANKHLFVEGRLRKDAGKNWVIVE